MKVYKKLLLFNLLPFTLVVFFDQLTKITCSNFQGHYLKIFNIAIFHNKGIIFSHFSELPLALNVIFFSTFLGLFIFIYVLLLYLFHQKSNLLNAGMAIFMGGISSNIIDRTLHSSIIDFVNVNIFPINRVVFNLADMFQWIGFILILISIIINRDKFWPNDNVRQKFLVNVLYQTKIAVKFSVLIFIITFTLTIFSYTFLKTVVLLDISRYDKDTILISFVVGQIIIGSIFLIINMVNPRLCRGTPRV